MSSSFFHSEPMRKLALEAAAFLACAAMSANAAQTIIADPRYSNTIERATTLITARMAEYGLVGCGVALVDGADTVWMRGFGYADKELGIEADADTVFMIGSCTKTFGALAAMQLVEQGRLDLDAPFTNALPSFAIIQRFPGNVITARSILTHHSGIPGDIFNGGFTIAENLSFPDWLEEYLAADYTLMPTNTCWAYNNSGFVMLGKAIERLSGLSAAEYGRVKLFDVMGMTNTSLLRDLPHIEAHLARPYIAGQQYPDEYCNAFYAGSIYSTARDMSRYMRMLLAGGMGENGRVISAASLAAMTTKQNADIPLDQFSSALNMGIGFILDYPTLNYMGKNYWHDGGTIYFRTMMRIAEAAGLAFFISWNSAEAGAVNAEIADAVLQWAYEEKTGTPPPAPVTPEDSPAAPAPPETLALACGTYVTGSGYDTFQTNAVGLLWTHNAHTDNPVQANLTYRQNGFFTLTNSLAVQLLFTNTAGHVIAAVKTFSGAVTNMSFHGEKAEDLAGFPEAWTNRLGRWWCVDMHPDDLSWLLPSSMIPPLLELYSKDNMFMVAPLASRESVFVIRPADETLGFAAGLGRNKGTSLRAVYGDGGENLLWLGGRYCRQDAIPELAPGETAAGIVQGDETHWFRMPVPAGKPVSVRLASEHDIGAYVYDTNSCYLGLARPNSPCEVTNNNSRGLMLAVSRCGGTNVGPFMLRGYVRWTPGAFAEHGADLSVYSAGSGLWYARTVGGEVVLWAQECSAPGMTPAPGDYDGDGRGELAAYDETTGLWFIRTGSGQVLAWAEPWGGAGFSPVMGDYDGDGLYDMAVYHAASGAWFIRTLDGRVLAWDFWFGRPNAAPAPGDYDGDGAWDPAFYSEASGLWYACSLRLGILLWAEPWGGAGFSPVMGDYDGDGLYDMAVYHAASGAWFIRSASGVLLWNFSFGRPGDTPVPGDYDDDGAWDLAVYGETDGLWHIYSLRNGVLLWNTPWGGPGLTPIMRR